MSKVNYRINIGAVIYSSNEHFNITELQVNASLDEPLNYSCLILGLPKALNIAPQDPVKIELGYDEDLDLIFTGIVESAEWGINHVSVHAVSLFQSLMAIRFNLFYEGAKAGGIISDITGRLGLSSAKVEDGLEFPAFALTENQTVYDQFYCLARQCGFDLYADSEDRVVFSKYNPLSTHPFQYGMNILAIGLEDHPPSIEGVEVYGESPSSLGQGADAYSWLAKKEVKGSAGTTTGRVLHLSNPALRDLDSAGSVAQSILEDMSKAKSGWIKALGYPKAKLGDAIQLSDMPDSRLNGNYKITGVKHVLSKPKGYTTTIYWEEE